MTDRADEATQMDRDWDAMAQGVYERLPEHMYDHVAVIDVKAILLTWWAAYQRGAR